MMSHPATPWIGLAAIVAMFVLPFLPAWLFEGPRTVKRYPRRVVCGDCGELWTDDHRCSREVEQRRPALRAELQRVGPGRALARRSPRSLRRSRF
jgi:hypothetical protein